MIVEELLALKQKSLESEFQEELILRELTKTDITLNQAKMLSNSLDETTALTSMVSFGLFAVAGSVITLLGAKTGFLTDTLGNIGSLGDLALSDIDSNINAGGMSVGYGESLSFDEAVKGVFKSEGGFANQKYDRGGKTNMGITQGTYSAWLRKHGKPNKDVRYLTKDEATLIYRDEYWVASGANKIKDPALSYLHFDTAVNFGVGRANSFLKASGGNFDKYLQIRKNFRTEIINKDRTQLKFKQGWENRDNRVAKEALSLRRQSSQKPVSKALSPITKAALNIQNKDKIAGDATSQDLLRVAKAGNAYDSRGRRKGSNRHGYNAATDGHCSATVQIFLKQAGFDVSFGGKDAWQMIGYLRNHRNFIEVPSYSVRPGDVVVYDKSAKHRYGHIFVSDGGINSGYSDYSGPQLANPSSYGAVHVFRAKEKTQIKQIPTRVRDVSQKNSVKVNQNANKITGTPKKKKGQKNLKNTERKSAPKQSSKNLFANIGVMITGSMDKIRVPKN